MITHIITSFYGISKYFSLYASKSGLEVIKLEYSLKLKIKHNDWLSKKQPIIALYFEFENELKFCNSRPGAIISLSDSNYPLSQTNFFIVIKVFEPYMYG